MRQIFERWSSARMALVALAPVIAAGLALLAAGGAHTGDGFDHDGLARQALDHHIRPIYADFSSKADQLQQALETACRRRTAGDEQAVKDKFRDVVVAWSRSEHLRFGPITDKNRFERIFYWPDRQRIGERQIAQILSRRDPSAVVADELAKKSVALQGLTALEVVLYGKRGGTILADTPDGQFACAYATAIAANIAGIAKEIVGDWADEGEFAQLWLKPGEQNPLYKTSSDRTMELLKAYRVGIYQARDIKLLPSLGLKRVAARGQLAPKSQPPFALSVLSVATMAANMEGVLDLYVNGGLEERLRLREPETAKLTRRSLEQVVADMRAAEAPGQAAFTDPVMMEKLGQVRDPMAFSLAEGGQAMAEIAGMGSLVLGFIDEDGD